MLTAIKSNNQFIGTFGSGVSLTLKREDLIHPTVSGNKFRKLKYNLMEAKRQNKNLLLTFGGAYSNHIAATAAAGKEFGFKTIGIIRGEELIDKITENPTLNYSQSCGMHLKFVSRDDFRRKNTEEFINELISEFGDFYLIPEGGTNELAVKGCEEILDEADTGFDFICCSAGTGGTVSGLINSTLPHQKVLAFSALKGNFLIEEIHKFAKRENWELICDYHFGGYAKVNGELIAFVNKFKLNHNIALDPIYTGKMIFGIMDLIERDFFPKHSNILAIHTGGLQGIKGINQKLQQQNKTLIV
ncbi:MAG: pyridoxal-phosphate dependent enzyme [Bacteroidota bacterium]